jgi:formamidopyrimidine-DNA glycosylase
MPELPEVETFARNLRPALTGRTITAARLLWARTLAAPAPDEFQRRITGQVICQVNRRGKFLILQLSADYLLIHLRMSGDLRLGADAGEMAPHDRLILSLDDGARLAFNDTRKFGRVWLVQDADSVVGNLGPEPLGKAFTPGSLYQALQARRRQLKPLLLDQTFIAGLGNIYADESLHRARLHPLTLSQSVSLEQARELWTGIRETLREGIRRQGASIDWVYRGGDFQNHFRAYQRTGQPCPKCGTQIERIIVGQRGTHYCPTCQPRNIASSREVIE